MVGIEEAEDFRAGIFAMVVLKNLSLHSHRIVVAEMLCDLHRAMDGGIAADKSTHEADDDDGRCFDRGGCSSSQR